MMRCGDAGAVLCQTVLRTSTNVVNYYHSETPKTQSFQFQVRVPTVPFCI